VTVVFFSDISWDSLYQRPQHLATRLAGRARILWVEPATLGSRFRLIPREQVPGVFRISLPAFPLNARIRWIRRTAVVASRLVPLRRAVERIQGFLLRLALRRMKAQDDLTACLVENFLFMPLTRALHPRTVVFDYIDDAFGFTAFPQFVRDEWLSTLRRADEVTVTSATLRQRINEAQPRSVRIVPNGVEFERFAHPAGETRPPDLPPADRPIFGYTGSIYPWIDFDLLEYAVRSLPEYWFVLIGYQHPAVAGDMSKLLCHRNFLYLGLKPYAAMPAYVRSFAAGMIPFKRTLLTEGVNPVKLYEYSAAGVPTVVTDFSDDTHAFSDLVLIARTNGEFVQNLRTAVIRRTDQSFQARLSSFAGDNDWNSRAREMSSLLQLEGS
jgi:glycosyltransferase involved in cell wall biosynthesis